MPTAIPTIPENITVHLGAPSASAANVTVSYIDYIKNVVSSEIYPTWDESAIRANILAINSYALNRIFTEYYRSRGYDFDITNTTAYDQSFVNGRSTFENTDRLVEELFDDYLRRENFIEPLAAKFCNGTTSVCDGLSQWGSQGLAEDGYNSVQILQAYYGDDVEIVTDAPVGDLTPSYPGTALRRGDTGNNVTRIQIALNRISQNYPAIPKINPVNGTFDEQTEAAVLEFQRIFNLTADGIVGKATWYQTIRIYVAIKQLAELHSEGLSYYDISWAYPDALKLGDSGAKISHLQYMLSVLAPFIDEIPEITVTGTFSEPTRDAVLGFQRYAGLPETGEVGAQTWDYIYRAFYAIERVIFRDAALFPFTRTTQAESLPQLQRQLMRLSAAYPQVGAPSMNGRYDNPTRDALVSWQTHASLPKSGRADRETLRSIADALDDLRYAATSRFTQFPGYDLSLGQSDPAMTDTSRMNRSLYYIGRPIRSLQTMLRLISIEDEDISPVVPDGIYGTDTIRSVTNFQRKHGLPVTGIVNLGTWNEIVRVFLLIPQTDETML